MARAPLDGRSLVCSLLREGLSASVRVTGHSMAPLIRSQDVVVISPLGAREPQVGDVLAAAVDGRLLVHRLVRFDRGLLVMRGDTAACCDPLLPPGDVLGIVTRVERLGRRIRLGTVGPERRLIAWLSRAGCLRLAATLRERARHTRLAPGPQHATGPRRVTYEPSTLPVAPS